MYHIYHTRGFILDSKPIGESNRLFYIYTKDFGNIVVVAQGVRELKSKLRFSLQDFSMSEVSVVRGKDMWRVTNAQEEGNFHVYFETPEKKRLVALVALMVKRLVPGEERNELLFSVLDNALHFLARESCTQEEIIRAEYVINLQILAALGYASDKPTLTPFIENAISKELLKDVAGKEKLAIKEINETLAQSQL